VRLQLVELGAGIAGEHGCDPRIQLSPVMADLVGGVRRGAGGVERLTLRAEIQARMGHLAAIGDFDAAKAMSVSKLDRLGKVTMRRDHPATDIVGIAESTERIGLQLGNPRLAGTIQALAVLREAAVQIAPRKAEIAAQEVDARPLGGQAHLDGRRLGQR
jgi:hypothetical protein